jgi:hypothetical protein
MIIYQIEKGKMYLTATNWWSRKISVYLNEHRLEHKIGKKVAGLSEALNYLFFLFQKGSKSRPLHSFALIDANSLY